MLTRITNPEGASGIGREELVHLNAVIYEGSLEVGSFRLMGMVISAQPETHHIAVVKCVADLEKGLGRPSLVNKVAAKRRDDRVGNLDHPDPISEQIGNHLGDVCKLAVEHGCGQAVTVYVIQMANVPGFQGPLVSLEPVCKSDRGHVKEWIQAWKAGEVRHDTVVERISVIPSNQTCKVNRGAGTKRLVPDVLQFAGLQGVLQVDDPAEK
jgi:hypothetical protein